MESIVFLPISSSLPSECLEFCTLSQKDLNLLDNIISATVLSSALPVYCSLLRELPAIVSPSKLPLSLLLWAVMSLVNPWRAALQSPRSTPDYYVWDTTRSAASSGRETRQASSNGSTSIVTRWTSSLSSTVL